MDVLNSINGEFLKMKVVREEILISFDEIKSKIESLAKVYIEITSRHKNNECIIGLDSLYFQNELIKLEYKNLKEPFAFINNRIYCEYYKLYHAIRSYIKDEFHPSFIAVNCNTDSTFPVYKSLNPLNIYDFSLVSKLYSNIFDMLKKIIAQLGDEENEKLIDQEHMKMGLNIDNVLHSRAYLRTIKHEKTKMFALYLKTFQRHHLKYLTRLQTKIKLVLDIIHDDIGLITNKNVGELEIRDSKFDSTEEQVNIVINEIVSIISNE
uniref:Uncharacterized protein n=1 Tax=viral metagenome TaxID=1070528 RepID=A0A6C0BY50_9ZZZZ